MRRRWPRALIAILLLVLVGALAARVLSSRRLEGAVPGKSPILGLAALDRGFLVGTAQGLFSSRDGLAWSHPESFAGKEALVADGENAAVVWSGGVVATTSDLVNFHSRDLGGNIVALAATAQGDVYAVRDPSHITVLQGGRQSELALHRGPPEIIALAVQGGGQSVLAGGLRSGLWRSQDGGNHWSRILQTPVRAILTDRSRPGRIYIATGGGILVSDDGRSWSFTDLRLGVEALAQSGGSFFAMTSDRLLYRSEDGLTWTRAAK